MADRYDNLNHNTLMASIGSMSRRWKEAIFLPAPRSIEEIFTTEGPDGLVIADEMGAAIHQTTILNDAIRAIGYLDQEPIPGDTLDAMMDRLDGERPKSAAAAIAGIVAIDDEVYARLTELRMEAWSRTPEGPQDGPTVSITDLAKGVSRVNAERLARATRVVAALR